VLYTTGMKGNVLGSSNARQFDVADESQIIGLLQMVRHSTLDDETKDDIRDIVCEYQTAHKPELLEELQLFVQPLGVAIVGAEAPATDSAPKAEVVTEQPTDVSEELKRASTMPTMGRIRPVPQWRAASTTPATVRKVPVTIRSVADTAPTAKEKPEVPVSITPKAQEPATPTPPAASVMPTSESVVAQPAVVNEVENPTASGGVTDTQTAQARIAEIKRTVNTAVGNPVNLIDVDNAVGREYMAALLDAMKAAVTGGQTLMTSMERLEKAYTAVEPLLHVPPKAQEPATPTPPATPVVSTPATKTVVEETSTTQEPATKLSHDNDEEHISAVEEASQLDVEEHKQPESEVAETTQQPIVMSGEAPRGSVAAMARASAKSTPKPTPSPDTEKQKSDPLMNEQITSGLAQLLSEWKLFHSSGVFGTGPHGIDHPLYQEMRNTPMNAIISGRFEGATPEIRQSVTDYMNGWRYEQGMTHDMQETFEHYLRRVIKTIIDKRASTMA